MGQKIPKGYQGTYAKNANGGATLIAVSRTIDMTLEKPKTKGGEKVAKATQTAMPNVAPQAPARQPYTPWTTEQKKEYARQFTPRERESYHKGRQNAYQHAANMAGRQAKFIRDNKDN